jgi:hypothetical protein
VGEGGSSAALFLFNGKPLTGIWLVWVFPAISIELQLLDVTFLDGLHPKIM